MIRKHFSSSLGLALAIGCIAMPAALRAQGTQAQTGSQASQQPASMEVVNSMNLAAAVSACELAVTGKTSLQNSVLASSQAIAYVVSTQFGGQIVNTNKLQPEQILNGSIIQTVSAIKQGCYGKLKAPDQKFVDEIISQAEKQLKNQPPSK